jgi:pimeloyl-ACP methyl ester carboxylesterase
LRDYVTSVSRPRLDGAVELAYAPAWEARIYETGPLDLWGEVHRLRPPMLAIRGADTDAFTPAGVRALRRRLPTVRLVEMAGVGHLAPMEKPEAAAQVIFQFLDETLEVE